MSRVRIWDLVVRSFHWLLAAGFLVAFAIATLSDGESAVFPLHALIGLAIVFIVVLRLVWAVVGSRWARFSSFDFRPSALVRYVRGTLGGPPVDYAGHNPASSWFVAAAVAVLLGLGVTGFMMGRGNESVEELHEVLAWLMLALAAVHVAGVAWHVIRRRENIALGMVTGYKNAEPSAGIRSVRPWSATAFLILTAIFVAALAARYDAATGRVTLPLAKTTLQLREAGEKDGAQQTLALEHDDGDEDDH